MNGLYALSRDEVRFDERKHKLGPICVKGHEWQNSGLSIRQASNGKCVECCRLRYYILLEQNRKAAKERMAAKRQANPEYSKLVTARLRACNGRESRAKGIKGLQMPPGRALTCVEAKAVRALVDDGHPLDWPVLAPLVEAWVDCNHRLAQALRDAGRSPSVARLVMDEQRRYWRENPEAKKEHDRQSNKAKWQFDYLTKPELRIYTRQKSKRRKAQIRNQTAHQIKPGHILDRFAQFDHRCAYCGAEGDMQIEHVVPISKGGTHAMGNIVPACQRCNFSKTDNEVERWYRSQPFFSELRWRKIRRVLNWDRGAVGQLALL